MADIPKVLTNILIIHSDHSRTEALASIRSMKEFPIRLLSLISEFASDSGLDWPSCYKCQDQVYVTSEEMKQKRGYTTWTVIEGLTQDFVCDKCLPEFKELMECGKCAVCLDCGSGAFDEIEFWCHGCHRGAVHEECFEDNVAECIGGNENVFKTCHQCLVGGPSPSLYRWKTWNQRIESGHYEQDI